jgi:hypothetical protein
MDSSGLLLAALAANAGRRVFGILIRSSFMLRVLHTISRAIARALVKSLRLRD